MFSPLSCASIQIHFIQRRLPQPVHEIIARLIFTPSIRA